MNVESLAFVLVISFWDRDGPKQFFKFSSFTVCSKYLIPRLLEVLRAVFYSRENRKNCSLIKEKTLYWCQQNLEAPCKRLSVPVSEMKEQSILRDLFCTCGGRWITMHAWHYLKYSIWYSVLPSLPSGEKVTDPADHSCFSLSRTQQRHLSGCKTRDNFCDP